MIEINYDQNRKMLNISVSGTSDFDEFSSTLETITNSTEYPPNIRAGIFEKLIFPLPTFNWLERWLKSGAVLQNATIAVQH